MKLLVVVGDVQRLTILKVMVFGLEAFFALSLAVSVAW